ncbi:hypothetical protein [Faecalibaculum rodentium]|uniref:hypothetical protein n=1 Tax=Faecalibaculum rodentium TaxID=1702221 RepID=UPI00257314E2|nr:hypothetical protein [Faecalibaculum rodentium]
MQKTITIEQTGDEIYRIGASDVLDVREIDAVVSVSIQQLVKAGDEYLALKLINRMIIAFAEAKVRYENEEKA